MPDSSISETSLLISRSGVPYDEPDKRSSYQKQLAIYIILASTALERIAFYALVINLVITLQTSELNWDSGNTITISFIFSGVSYISTLIFAALSDGKLGRAKTLVIGFCLYLIGYVLVILITNTDTRTSMCSNSNTNNNINTTSLINERCFGSVIGTLIVTGIGVGAIQANMAVFGAEQFRESNKPLRYFDKYIVAVNIGGIFATVVVSCIQIFIDHSNRYFYGYLFAISSLVCAIILLILGKRCYIHIEPHDTIITKCIPVVINAFQTWRKHKNDISVTYTRHTNATSTNFLMDSMNDSNTQWSTTKKEKLSSFLDYAKASNNGKYIDRIVEDVKSLRRVILVFIFLIPYWLIYYQIQTTFVLQGQHMDIPFISNNSSTRMPPTWMSLGDQISIIIGILILNLFIYKHLEIRNKSISIQTKFITGMIFAVITMIIAGTVEEIRQNYCVDGSRNSKLSIFIQLPQYIGMGISEMFAMVASFEFAYLAAPRSAQSLIMSLRFCSLGLSSFINDGYVKIFTRKNEKFAFDCPRSRHTLYIYFYVLSGIQIVTIIIFILCNRKFKMLKLNPQKINKRQFI